MIDTELGREAFIGGFDVVWFLAGVMMDLIRWGQGRELQVRRRGGQHL